MSGAMARPGWFRRTVVPLTVVCGPPGAGKSRWCARRAEPWNVIDFDAIAVRLFGPPGARRPAGPLSAGQVADVLRARNERLGELMRPSARDEWPSGALLIASEPKAEHRLWWSRTVGAQVVVLATPAALCKTRIAADAAAGDDRGADAAARVDAWWAAYRPATCDKTLRGEDGR